MKPPLDGGVILITGASAGLGTEFARHLAGRAKRLILVARRVDRLESLRAELTGKHPALEVTLQPCDLVDRAATDRMLAALPPIDVLVNNAGMGDMGMFERAPWPKTEAMIGINITALTYLTQRLLPGMIERRRGGILNVSSGFGLEFLPGFAAYAATKHYVSAFTESLRLELRPHNIAVSHLCPGPVATEFEEIAGNFTGIRPPGWIELTAVECVGYAVKKFARGRALIIPGLFIKFLLGLGAISPRWLKRLVYRPVATRLRRMQDRHRAALPKAS
jgi:uncharacterized protein